MIQLRTAACADIDLIYSLNEELIRRYEDLTSIDLDAMLAWVRRKVTKLLPEYRMVVRDGETIGCFHLSRPEDDCLEIDDLYVLPASRNQGVGTQILDFCIAESARLSLPLMLYVFTRNTRAIALYERMGFAVSETVSPTRVIMRRPL